MVISEEKEIILSISISSLRIIAVAGIFLFHILALYHYDNRNIDFYSILIFCFLSGYLSSNINKLNRLLWLKKRFFSIMVSYWIVIIPALVLNRFFNYKHTLLLGDIVTLLGGNMFLETKVYVEAWYITFVLLLYIFIFLQSFAKVPVIKLFCWFLAFLLFTAMGFSKSVYFLAFTLGFLLSQIVAPPKKAESGSNVLSILLFKIQRYGYDFFLLHGGILVFLSVVMKLDIVATIVLGLLITILGSLLLNKVSGSLIRRLV